MTAAVHGGLRLCPLATRPAATRSPKSVCLISFQNPIGNRKRKSFKCWISIDPVTTNPLTLSSYFYYFLFSSNVGKWNDDEKACLDREKRGHWFLFQLLSDLLSVWNRILLYYLPGLGTPSFAETVPNITVVAGKDVVLPCVVDNLEHFKVAWVRVDTQTILTIHTKVNTNNQQDWKINWVVFFSQHLLSKFLVMSGDIAQSTRQFGSEQQKALVPAVEKRRTEW